MSRSDASSRWISTLWIRCDVFYCGASPSSFSCSQFLNGQQSILSSRSYSILVFLWSNFKIICVVTTVILSVMYTYAVFSSLIGSEFIGRQHNLFQAQGRELYWVSFWIIWQCLFAVTKLIINVYVSFTRLFTKCSSLILLTISQWWTIYLKPNDVNTWVPTHSNTFSSNLHAVTMLWLSVVHVC